MPTDADDFLKNAVEHRLISQDVADRLADEAKLQSISPRSFAIKSGVLSSWQVETINVLSDPAKYVPGFHVDSVLGKGGFGTVYKATQLNLDRQVALKTIPLQNLKDDLGTRRFEREARIIGGMNHPHIVAAYDFGFHENLLYLSLELVDGKDLAKLLKARGRLDEFTTWQILKQVASALAYAQERNVIHRDIKPGNLMLASTPAGYPLPDTVPFIKVTDFGLACFNQSRPGDNTITAAGTGLGTPSYVAPEQLTGDKVDQRADIYALGATAYHMLRGKPAYHEISPVKVMSKKVSGDENWVESLSGEVSEPTFDLIRLMAVNKVEERIQSHTILLQKIDEVLQRLGHQSTYTDSTAQFDAASDAAGDSFVLATGVDSSSRSYDESMHDEPTNVSIKDLSKKTVIFSRKSFLAGAAIAVIAALGSILFFLNPSNRGPTTPEITLRNGDNVVQVYNGFRVNNSAFVVSGGQLEKYEDDEGGRVLLGSNCRISFPCRSSDGTAFEYLTFSVGMRIQDAASVMFSAVDENDNTEFTLEFTQEGYKLKQESGESKEIMWNVNPNDQTGYVQIDLTRNNVYWTVLVDRKVVGKVPHSQLSMATIVLETRGKSLFENPHITEKIDKAPEHDAPQT